MTSSPVETLAPLPVSTTTLLGERDWAWQDRAQFVSQLKSAMKAAQARALEVFRALAPWEEASGLECARELSGIMDQVLSVAHHHAALAHPDKAGQLALVACGGYGRQELCPASDIDLMILVPDGQQDRLTPVIEHILYVLWDLGLTLGHAVRSPSDCRSQARADQTVLTTLLEARLVIGNAPLFADLRALYRRRLQRGQAGPFVRAKLAEVAARHGAGLNGRYRVEPDLKDGPTWSRP